MTTRVKRTAFAVSLLLAACSGEAPTPILETDEEVAYVTLEPDLGQFKADFNAMADKIRLVFISGPSCGVCLRGMDDLSEAIVDSLQNDPRVHTFVLYVPTLGAEERHVRAAMPLLRGPRISHYWDAEGHSGLQFQETLDIPMYAWDVWMVYEPGAHWDAGAPPPEPAFWQHQLAGLPRDQRLDADEFAAAITARLDKLPPAAVVPEPVATARPDSGVLPVEQPLGVVIGQNHMSRGGYQKLKTIESIRYHGDTEIGGHRHALSVETARPGSYRRIVSDGAARFVVSWDGTGLRLEGSPPGVEASIPEELLASYEFDGWITDWKDKGHQLWRLGMKKHGDRLPWILLAELGNNRNWHIYVDSHTGDAFRQALLDADGVETLAIEFDDYREVDGFRLPHRVRYFDGDRLLVTDQFKRVEVVTNVERAVPDG